MGNPDEDEFDVVVNDLINNHQSKFDQELNEIYRKERLGKHV